MLSSQSITPRDPFPPPPPSYTRAAGRSGHRSCGRRRRHRNPARAQSSISDKCDRSVPPAGPRARDENSSILAMASTAFKSCWNSVTTCYRSRRSMVPYGIPSQGEDGGQRDRPRRNRARKVVDDENSGRAAPILGAGLQGIHGEWLCRTSTLAIATTRAVSKRALYALVGNTQEMLVACISERAKRLHAVPPGRLTEPAGTRRTLARIPGDLGTQLLRRGQTILTSSRSSDQQSPEAIRRLVRLRRNSTIGGETGRFRLAGDVTGARSSGDFSADHPANGLAFTPAAMGPTLMVGLLFFFPRRR